MSNQSAERFVIYDTEYTAWEGSLERNWSGPNEYRELLQFGAVAVSMENGNLEANDRLLIHCKPTRNPELSPYIMNLTGISQLDIDTKGMPFAEFADRIWGFSDGGRLPMFSWGRTDDSVLQENYRLNGMAWPDFTGGFHDVRKVFISHGVDATAFYSGEISRHFGIAPEGRIHDAMHDALSIFEALRALFQDNPMPELQSLKSVCGD